MPRFECKPVDVSYFGVDRDARRVGSFEQSPAGEWIFWPNGSGLTADELTEMAAKLRELNGEVEG